MILPLPRTGPVEPLQIAIHHENEIVEFLARRNADGAHGFRLVDFAVTQETPDLASFGVGEAAVLQVLHEAGLVDRHDGTQSHGYRGELPEIRHHHGWG
jgi:hypothetical protein